MLGPKDAGFELDDLHSRGQTVAMPDAASGEILNVTLTQEGNNVPEFYSVPSPTERLSSFGLRFSGPELAVILPL